MSRVAFILPSFAGGGAERVVLQLIAGLDRARFHPELVVLSGDGPFKSRLRDDVPLTDLGIPRLRSALPALLRTIRKQAPAAVVSTFGYVNLALLAARRRIPGRLLLREANMPSLSLGRTPWPAAFRLGYRRLYRHADTVICSSGAMAAEMTRDFGVPADRIALLSNPVDVADLRGRAARPARETGPGVRFVAAGRLTRQKGFDRLLDMFARLPGSAGLTVFGDGPDRADLDRRVDRLGLADRVRFAGFEPNPWPWYAGADAFLLPSRWEGMPNAALESLALGTPVVATPEAGAIAEVARAAPESAVRIAEAGDPFIAQLSAVSESPAELVAASLLPRRFHAATVRDDFADILARGIEGP